VENRVEEAIVQFEASLPGTDSVPDLVALHVRKGDLNAYVDGVKRFAARDSESAEIQAELGQVYEAIPTPSML
ncbi:MAG: hypothetical protein KGO02_24790, partial [Alphaproteobacteria bacterium]|nr:hypothetical protein [Alphaproteobacteria bacterium]